MRWLTVLNTLLDVAVFHRPFPMWMYATRGLGEVVRATQSRRMMAPIMWRIGAPGPASVSRADIDAYLELAAVHEVAGRHFLQEDSPEEIARLVAGFEGELGS